MTDTTRARLGILCAAMLASTGGAAIKTASLSAFQVAGLRSGIATLVLLALLRPGPGSWSGGALLVGLVQGAMMTLFVAGNKLTTAASAIYLQSTAPLYVLLLAPLVLGERIRRVDLAYLAVFAVGLGLFFVRSDATQATAPDPIAGNLVAATGGALWALTILGLRGLASRPAPGRDRAGAATVLANFAVFAACLPWIVEAPARASASDWGVLLWLGVVQVGFVYALLARSVRRVAAFEVSMLMLAEPVLSPFWAWIVHGEKPGPWSLAGGGLILAASTLRTWRAPSEPDVASTSRGRDRA